MQAEVFTSCNTVLKKKIIKDQEQQNLKRPPNFPCLFNKERKLTSPLISFKNMKQTDAYQKLQSEMWSNHLHNCDSQ